jgi:hypothetical protein
MNPFAKRFEIGFGFITDPAQIRRILMHKIVYFSPLNSCPRTPLTLSLAAVFRSTWQSHISGH